MFGPVAKGAQIEIVPWEKNNIHDTAKERLHKRVIQVDEPTHRSNEGKAANKEQISKRTATSGWPQRGTSQARCLVHR